MAKYRIRVSAVVEIEIAEGVTTITRCTENHDDEGNPQPVGRDVGEKGWQDYYYPLDTEQEVLEALAFTAIANGQHDASSVDGWADLERGQTTMTIDRRSFYYDDAEAVVE